MTIDYELENAKRAKRKEIKWWMDNVEESTLEVLGITWHAGYNSGQRLDGARRLSMEAGMTHVGFSDVDNVYHNLTIAEATQVVMAIGQDFQTKFAQQQAWKIQTDNATSIAELPDLG